VAAGERRRAAAIPEVFQADGAALGREVLAVSDALDGPEVARRRVVVRSLPPVAAALVPRVQEDAPEERDEEDHAREVAEALAPRRRPRVDEFLDLERDRLAAAADVASPQGGLGGVEGPARATVAQEAAVAEPRADGEVERPVSNREERERAAGTARVSDAPRVVEPAREAPRCVVNLRLVVGAVDVVDAVDDDEYDVRARAGAGAR